MNRCCLGKPVKEITADSLVLQDSAGAVSTIPNDMVAIFAGGGLPTRFLQSCGVKIDVKFGVP